MEHNRPHPWMYAIALHEQRFSSQRVAIRKGQGVVLEFYPSMIVVHDPLQKSPSANETLGTILFSYHIPYFRNPDITLQSVRTDGIVRKPDCPDGEQQFHLLNLLSVGKRTECQFCGRLWLEKLSKEHAQHLNAHITKEGLR